MKRNLTLSIDDELLQAARLAALKQRQSLTALIREFLERIARDDQDRSRAADRLKRRMAERPIKVSRRTWTRDELHER